MARWSVLSCWRRIGRKIWTKASFLQWWGIRFCRYKQFIFFFSYIFYLLACSAAAFFIKSYRILHQGFTKPNRTIWNCWTTNAGFFFYFKLYFRGDESSLLISFIKKNKKTDLQNFDSLVGFISESCFKLMYCIYFLFFFEQ